jgi:hypothetical protein
MKIGVAWDFVSAKALPNGILVNPRCPAILHDNRPCGRLATIRVTDQRGMRSTFWCPFHVFPQTEHDLDSPRWEDYYIDWERHWSRFPDSMQRDFIRR